MCFQCLVLSVQTLATLPEHSTPLFDSDDIFYALIRTCLHTFAIESMRSYSACSLLTAPTTAATNAAFTTLLTALKANVSALLGSPLATRILKTHVLGLRPYTTGQVRAAYMNALFVDGFHPMSPVSWLHCLVVHWSRPIRWCARADDVGANVSMSWLELYIYTGSHPLKSFACCSYVNQT